MDAKNLLSSFTILAQEERFSCGPAVIRMIAHFFGIKISEREAGRLCRYNPKSGTIHWFFRSGLERVLNGVEVTMVHSASWQDIEASLAKGLPVPCIFMSDNGENPLMKDAEPGHYPHYCIILSVNALHRTVTVANPFGEQENIPLDEWHGRWGLASKYLVCENPFHELLWRVLKLTGLMKPRTCFFLNANTNH